MFICLYFFKGFKFSLELSGRNILSFSRVYNTEIGDYFDMARMYCNVDCWKEKNTGVCFNETKMPGRDVTLIAECNFDGANTLNAFIAFALALIALVLF